MSEKKQIVESAAKTKRQHKAQTPVAKVQDKSAASETAGLQGGDIKAQAAWLQRLNPAQQQGALRSINRVQGNLHAQGVISAMGRGRTAARAQAPQAGSDGTLQAPEDVEAQIKRMQGGGHPLPDGERDFFKERMGADFSGVRLHTDPQAAQSSQELQARAYTVGSDIFMSQGEYQTGTEDGRRLMAHELTHVVQQGQARELERDAVQRQEDDQKDSGNGKEPKAPKRDKKRLKALFDAVKETAIGKEFLSLAGSEPTLVWGNTGGYNGTFDGNQTITLDETQEDILGDCEWMQVIAMELGNFANKAQFENVYEDAKQGLYDKEEFVKAMIKIEWGTRDKVIDACAEGQFVVDGVGCESIFTGGKMTFEDFFADSRNKGHRSLFGNEWKKNYKKSYKKKLKLDKSIP